MENPFENKTLGIKVDDNNFIIVVTFLRSLGYRWSNHNEIVPRSFLQTKEEKIIYLTENNRLLYGTLQKYLENQYKELLLSYEDILILMRKCNYEISS